MENDKKDSQGKITGQNKTEVLAPARLFYAENIIDVMREPLVVLDAGLKVIFANRSFFQEFKVTPANTLGYFIYELGNKQWSIVKLRNLLEGVIYKNIWIHDFEVERVFPEIGRRTMLLNAQRIEQTDKRSHLILLFIKDVTEHNKMEMSLRESELRYRTLAEASHDFIFIIDINGDVVYVNSYGANEFGSSPKQIIGKNIKELFSDETAASQKISLQEVFKSGASLSVESKFKFPNRELWLNTWLIPLKDETGGVNSVLGVSRDITLRKEAEEILKRDRETLEKLVNEKTHELVETQISLERAKHLSDIGTLATIVAHELRNPLAAIKMAVYNIRRKIEDPSLDSHFNNIDKKIEESDWIINNLLSYSRIKLPHPERINVCGILEDCIETAKNLFKNENVSVVKKFEYVKDVCIEADQVQMKELFHNILNNAFEAIVSKRGKIEIEAELINGEFIKICIKDDGVGIDSKDLKRVYELFFTTKPKGTGLGLPVCQEIVKLHNGNMTIESQKDKGTTVSVILPLKNK